VLITGALLGLYLWAITAARQRVAALEPVPSTPPGAALEDLPPLGEPAAAARPPGAEDPAP
jgi:hypothetical protein